MYPHEPVIPLVSTLEEAYTCAQKALQECFIMAKKKKTETMRSVCTDINKSLRPSSFSKKASYKMLSMYNVTLSLTYFSRYLGEGNGNPLQYSCLENPMDSRAWWAAVHGVAKSRTRLSDFPFTFTFTHWRRKWQPSPVFLPGESQGWGSLVGCRIWGCTVGHD